MAISTNSIIHYTDTHSKLVGILKEGFAIKYCAEELIVGTNKSLAAHPMISFCDIPLSNANQHMKAYGYYGIGMTKEWANKLGVNPVLYFETGSSISKTLGELIKERRKLKSNLTQKQKSAILRIKCFTKNYSGPLKRKQISVKNYKFYDEREWRFVPESKDLQGAKFSVTLKHYKADKAKYNSQIEGLRFKFNPQDVAYIIVKKTAQIPKIIKLLNAQYKNDYSEDERYILFSKIVSTEQINNDY